MSARTDTDWCRTDETLPPEGVEVQVLHNSTGLVTTLKRRGSLWFTPDGKMYVYWTPTFWKMLNDEAPA